MKHVSSIALWVVCVSATALTVPAQAAPARRAAVGQLATLTFAPGSAVLTPCDEATELAAAALSWTRAHPDGLIVLDAHADPSGTQAHGLRLALQRAKAVRAYLVAAGVSPDQILIAAFAADGARDRSVLVWGTRVAPRAVASREQSQRRAA